MKQGGEGLRWFGVVSERGELAQGIGRMKQGGAEQGRGELRQGGAGMRTDIAAGIKQ